MEDVTRGQFKVTWVKLESRLPLGLPLPDSYGGSLALATGFAGRK